MIVPPESAEPDGPTRRAEDEQNELNMAGTEAAEDVATLSPSELGAAVVHIMDAKRRAKPRPGESERVVMGTLVPDRRLSNSDRDLQRKVNKSTRRRFRVGQLPDREFLAAKLKPAKADTEQSA